MTERRNANRATRNRPEGDESDMALTTADIASELNITPKHLRKFLRDDARATDKTDNLPGKGGRYSFEKKDLRSLKSRYTKWNAAETAKRAEIAAKRASDSNAEEGAELTE